jgi:hypothetical protein
MRDSLFARFAGIFLGAALVAAAAVAIAGHFDRDRSHTDRSRAPTAAPAGTGVAAQARADAFAEIARRIYDHEHAPVVGRSVVKHLGQDPTLIRALRTGDRALIRAHARRTVIPHEVRVRIVRGSQVLTDVGLPFVVQGAEADLRAPDGTVLGRVQVSIQDVIGFVKLVSRQTGTEVVVRGQGREATSLSAAARAPLPSSGRASLAGRTYIVRSFKEGDFVGKPLTVWVLDPVSR